MLDVMKLYREFPVGPQWLKRCLEHIAAEAIKSARPEALQNSVIVPRATLLQWESWARVRGNELTELTGGPSPIMSDGLADEMKAALEAAPSPLARRDEFPEHAEVGIVFTKDAMYIDTGDKVPGMGNVAYKVKDEQAKPIMDALRAREPQGERDK